MSDTIIINPSTDCDSIIINPIVDNETIVINSKGYVNSVNGRIGDIILNSSDVGLTIVNTNSGNWDSSYSSVHTNSALWTQGGNSVALQSLSSNWNSNYITTHALSANWNSVYSTVNSASSVWNLGGNSTILQSNSAHWNTAYAYVIGNSSIEINQQSVATVVNNTSANWNSVYSYVNTNSSIEYNQTAATSFVLVNSANIISVDSLVNSASANWNSVYSKVYTNSASWVGGNVAYTNLLANSSVYLQSRVDGTIYQIVATQHGDGSATLSLPQSIRTPGDLNVGGNLFIAGSGFKLNTSTLSVSSPIIYINNSLSGNGNVFDIGLVGHFNNGLYQHTGLVRSAEHNYWSLFSGLTSEPEDHPTINYNDPTFKIDTLRANIQGTLFGDVSAKTLIAGSNNHLNANNSFIIGSDITATEPNTTYVNNLLSQGLVTTTGLALYDSRVQYLERPVTANGNFIILNVNGEVQAIRLFTPILIATTYTNAAQDGDWSNLNNWTDIQGYPITTLPDAESVLTFTVPSFTQVSEGNASIKSCNFLVTTSWGNGITLTVSNSANFYNQSVLYGTLSGDASFYNNAQNNGIVGGYASFSGNSVNSGLVVKNAVFKNGATNQNFLGVIAGNAIVYYPSPYPIGGLVSGSVSYRGYFATKFVGTAGDGDWNNLANWRDDFDLPVVFLPTESSNVKIYSNVTSASGNSVAVNSATFYNNSVWGSGLTLTAPQVTLRQQSSNAGTLVGTNGSLFKLYNLATNTGTINSDVEVHHPCPNPIGGTVTGSVSYVGYVTPIISTQLVNIQGPSDITSISLTCNGNSMYPNFDVATEDYGVVTGEAGNTQVNYSLTINGNTTTGTINVDQALQIYNTTNIYYIRFINSSIPRPTIVSGPYPGYVPGYYTIGQNDYLPIIYNHNGVPVWYTDYPAISLHKGSDRNRVMIHESNTPHKAVYIGPSSLQWETYSLLNAGGWDIHEGQELAGPPNRKGNIVGHVYTAGFYIEEQTPNHQFVWSWEANDYYSGGWADYYHNNSVDVHPINGNLVLSNRHNGAAICVEFATKNVKWVISGRYPLDGTGTMEAVDRGTSKTANTKYISEVHSNLLNEPTYQGYTYSGTVGNHDARWHTDIPPIHGPNNVVFSIYDDQSPAGWGFGSNSAPAARGVIYEVDESAGIAYHRSSVFSPYGTSPYRGSYTVVHEDDGTWSHVLDNVVQNPVMLEFVGNIDTVNKPLVLEMQFYSNDPYRIIKIKKSFFDLNNLRATYGMSVN
jgi:hypothetical protein